mmetsp:Transcript_695/g.1447  ORF Transcript_695/g.1447 Transcript_695/m.1447 type:complete len:595 (+) Transcript_695:397-2181(+)
MAADSVLHAGDLAKKSDLLQLQTSLEQRFEKDFGKLREKLDVVDLEAKKRLVSHRQGLDELLEARFARWESRSSGVDEKLENFERRLQLIESTVAEQGAKTAVMEQVQKEAEFMHLGFSKAVTKDLHHLQDSLREILEECRRIVDARFQDCSDRCEQQLQESLRHAAASLPTTVTSEAAAAALAAQQAGQAAASGHYNGSFRPTGDQHFNNNSSSNNNNNNNSNSNQLPAIEDGSLGAATTTGIGLPYSSGEYGAIAQTEPVQVGRQTPSASPSQSPHRSSPGPGPNGSGPLARRASGSPLPPALAAAQLFANAIAKLALREARGEAAAARVQVDARHAELGVRCDALSGDVGRLRKTVDCIILELQEMGTVLDRNDSRRIEQLIHDLEVQIWPWRSARQWSRERASSPNRCRDQALPPPGQQQLSYNRSQKQQFTTTQQQHQHQRQQPPRHHHPPLPPRWPRRAVRSRACCTPRALLLLTTSARSSWQLACQRWRRCWPGAGKRILRTDSTPRRAWLGSRRHAFGSPSVPVFGLFLALASERLRPPHGSRMPSTTTMPTSDLLRRRRSRLWERRQRSWSRSCWSCFRTPCPQS